MDQHFLRIAAARVVRAESLRQLKESGFVILPDILSAKRLAQITAGYDKVMSSGPEPDFKIGTTTTRLYFVDCLLDFEDVYQHPALLEAVAHLIGEPFKLSSLLGRTLRAGSPAQDLHRDIARNSADAPIAGFILMLDPFRSDNGPTRFIPGSHNWPDRSLLANALNADSDGEVLARGTAGSIVVFNGAVWHGHNTNLSAEPRRSIQGYFVRRNAASGLAFSERLAPEVRSLMSPLSRYLLGL